MWGHSLHAGQDKMPTARPYKYFHPIFTRGQSSLVNPAGGTYTDGADVITFDNSGGAYVVGSHVFVSRTNNTIPEYLGQVTAADASSIATELVLSRGYSTDLIKVWQPTKFWRPIWGIGNRMQITPETGGSSLIPSGGGISNTQISAFRERLIVPFDKVRNDQGDLNNWLTFLFVDLLGGTKRTNFAFFDQAQNKSRMATVLMMLPGSQQWNVNLRKVLGSFTETFVVLATEEDSFITST